jgi:hypothetical protein
VTVRRRIPLALGLVVTAVGAGGCATLSLPGSTARSSTERTPASPLAQAERTHEYPSSPVTQTAAAPAGDAVAAVRRFAVAYINWRAATVSAELRALAARSIGQARSAAELEAAQTGQDPQLRQGGIANQGTVEALAPWRAHPHEYIVVTRERTTATIAAAYAGLQPAWHVTVATVTELAPGQWVVSGWQPES